MSRTAHTPPRLPSRAELETLIDAESMTPEQGLRFIKSQCAPVAFHEAAHAAAGMVFACNPTKIEINLRACIHFEPWTLPAPPPPDGASKTTFERIENCTGLATIGPPEGIPLVVETRHLIARAIIDAAGAAAECHRLKIPFRQELIGGRDRQNIEESYLWFPSHAERTALLVRCTTECVREHWGAIERLARALLARIQPGCGEIITMNASEIEAVLNAER